MTIRDERQLYEPYFGLREPPFKLTSNPRYLMLTPGHAEALNMVQHGIATRRGILVLVGEVGTGNTTIVRAAGAAAPGSRFVHLNNPLLTRPEFLHLIADGFGLPRGIADSKPRFVAELTRHLDAFARSDVQTALIADEAHALPNDILEEIRLLANIETDDEKLLPVVLVGQPELRERLNGPDLRQLKQRIALRCVLNPLGLRETAAYIAGRIRVAGGDAKRVFSRDAVELIHAYARGIPRTISVICDNAIVAGYALDERPVRASTVATICEELDLETPAGISPRDSVAPGTAFTFAPADSTRDEPGDPETAPVDDSPASPSTENEASSDSDSGTTPENSRPWRQSLTTYAGGLKRRVRTLGKP